MISKNFAQKNLTQAAIKRGIECGNYLAYEEDCDWVIIAFELSSLWGRIFEHALEDIKKNPQQYLLKTLSHWNADYLLERNITPEPEAFQKYQLMQLQDKMSMEKHPDLIISASMTDNPEVTKVWTADDEIHYVTKESYDKRIERKDKPNLLSLCEVIH